MSETTRRQFQHELLGSLLTFSLLETLFSRDAFAAEIRPLAAEWLADIDRMSRDLKGDRLTNVQWQEQVETLFGKVELKDLLRLLDFEKLTENVTFREQGERALRPKLPAVEGLPRELVYGHQVFALTKDRSVVPHGHNNMATAFLVLKGDFHGRHYDRLEDERESMIIKPTIDRPFAVGDYSTISDERDNVHWFTARSETAFLFNIHVMGVEEGRNTGRVYIDPDGEKLSGGRIRARKLKAIDAYKRYG